MTLSKLHSFDVERDINEPELSSPPPQQRCPGQDNVALRNMMQRCRFSTAGYTSGSGPYRIASHCLASPSPLDSVESRPSDSASENYASRNGEGPCCTHFVQGDGQSGCLSQRDIVLPHHKRNTSHEAVLYYADGTSNFHHVLG